MRHRLPASLFFEGFSRNGDRSIRKGRLRNIANPMVGSGMQQAREAVAEEAVEVAQNHEDGT